MNDSGIATNLAHNVALLRKKESLTQRQLAERAGLPRSTLTNIESGAGNPSLSNLVRLSDALGVGIEELLARPRSEVSLIPADKVRQVQRGAGRVQIAQLLPESVRGLVFNRMELQPGGTMRGTPHVPGTKEYLHCLEGHITMLIAGELFELWPGDVLAFPGDQAHSYMNRGRGMGRAVSLVVPLPMTRG